MEDRGGQREAKVDMDKAVYVRTCEDWLEKERCLLPIKVKCWR